MPDVKLVCHVCGEEEIFHPTLGELLDGDLDFDTWEEVAVNTPEKGSAETLFHVCSNGCRMNLEIATYKGHCVCYEEYTAKEVDAGLAHNCNAEPGQPKCCGLFGICAGCGRPVCEYHMRQGENCVGCIRKRSEALEAEKRKRIENLAPKQRKALRKKIEATLKEYKSALEFLRQQKDGPFVIDCIERQLPVLWGLTNTILRFDAIGPKDLLYYWFEHKDKLQEAPAFIDWVLDKCRPLSGEEEEEHEM